MHSVDPHLDCQDALWHVIVHVHVDIQSLDERRRCCDFSSRVVDVYVVVSCGLDGVLQVELAKKLGIKEVSTFPVVSIAAVASSA